MRAVISVHPEELDGLADRSWRCAALECPSQTDAGDWLTADAAAELRRRSERAGLAILAASADLSGHSWACAERPLTEQLAAHLASGCDRAERMGATLLALTTLRAGDPRLSAGAVPYATALNAVYAALGATHRRAEAAGLTIALTAARHRFLISPAECRDLVDEINANNVGILLDVEAIAPFGDATDWIQTLRHRLAAVRLKPPAIGSLRSLVEPLAAVRFDGALIFDSADSLDRARHTCPQFEFEELAPPIGNWKLEIGNPLNGAAAMPSNDLVTVATVSNALQAEQLKLRLHGEGIFCYLDGILQAGLAGVLPIEVKVRPADAERARQIIEPQNA